jgi:hypothetical protein
MKMEPIRLYDGETIAINYGVGLDSKILHQ